jgi:hypothetical protein
LRHHAHNIVGFEHRAQIVEGKPHAFADWTPGVSAAVLRFSFDNFPWALWTFHTMILCGETSFTQVEFSAKQKGMTKLYLVHCGFYDNDVCDGIYESHVNFFVAAVSFEEARKKAKELPEFKGKRMHVDGLQEIQSVDGFSVSLNENADLAGKSVIVNFKHRDLAPKPAPDASFGIRTPGPISPA